MTYLSCQTVNSRFHFSAYLDLMTSRIVTSASVSMSEPDPTALDCLHTIHKRHQDVVFLIVV